MNLTLFKEIEAVFEKINSNPTARVAVLQADGRLFLAGLDLKEFGPQFSFDIGTDGELLIT